MYSVRKSVLFLTNAEHGQANVILATAWELLRRDEFDVHIGSYSSLRSRVRQLNEDFVTQLHDLGKSLEKIPRVVYHEVRGVPMMEHVKIHNIPYEHSPSCRDIPFSFDNCARLMLRDDHDNYIKAYDDMVNLIKSIAPAVVVIDPLFYAATDACLSMGIEYIQLSPGSFYEVCAEKQPFGAQLWKYPAYVSILAPIIFG